ncbi:MAG: hypothetical protein K2J83_07845 [Clostridia bacterium]|nr:hypothetical protein [Clostridia bacterium]
MSQLDILFRAVEELRKRTSESGNERQLKRIISANPDSDRIEVVKTDCKIEKDWIEAIEAGLVHVEKAINEERQFIRSNGEVVPIEKVKQVSRESVEHLARHSNLLTRETDNDGVIPDKLYTVERLTDYAVYENKFLYMLLCYLRDFVSYRYEKICELTNTYSGSLQIKKDFRSGNSKTAVEIKLNERIINDEYTSRNNPVRDDIDRIDLILKTVVMLLSTPLMEDVSKSPMLKPPITETNVLKMNKHFKGAKELYYFLAAYDKDGFEAVQRTEVLSPFKAETAEDFAEVIALLSFMTYEHGLGLRSYLKENYERILKEEEEEKLRELKRKIKSLKKRIEESGKGAEEYMLLLEQVNRSLESDVAALAAAKAEIEKLNANIGLLQGNIESLEKSVSKHIAEEERLKAEHAEEMQKAVNVCAEQIKNLMDGHAQEMEAINSAHAQEIENLNEANDKKLEDIKELMQAESERADERYSVLQSEKSEAEKVMKELALQLEKMQNDKLLSDAELNAMRKRLGVETDDFTTEVRFDELEKQFNALKTLFKEEWKKTKKKIRREVLKPETDKKPVAEDKPKGEE